MDRLAEAAGAVDALKQSGGGQVNQTMGEEVQQTATSILAKNAGNKTAAIEQLDLLKQSVNDQDLRNSIDATMFRLHDATPGLDPAEFIKEAFAAAMSDLAETTTTNHNNYDGLDVHVTSTYSKDALAPTDATNKSDDQQKQ